MFNSHSLLFMVAQDFVQLNALQQMNIGIKLEVVGVETAMLQPQAMAELVFANSYKMGKMPDLIREMRNYLYEQG